MQTADCVLYVRRCNFVSRIQNTLHSYAHIDTEHQSKCIYIHATPVGCSVLQCVAVCCSWLQCLQCVAVCCGMLSSCKIAPTYIQDKSEVASTYTQHAATQCSTLQNTATHYNTLQHTATHCITLQHTATHCNTLQHTATHCIEDKSEVASTFTQHTATHCNTLQHTATHYNTLQHTTTHCNTLQHTAYRTRVKLHLRIRNTLQRTATHYNTLQHTATHCIQDKSEVASTYTQQPLHRHTYRSVQVCGAVWRSMVQ